MRLPLTVVGTAALALVFQGACSNDQPNPNEPVPTGPSTDAGPDGNGTGEAGTEGGPTGGVDPGPKFPWFFDGAVNAIAHAGSSLYFGGAFRRLSAIAAPRALSLDASGAPTACALGAGFDGDVNAIVQAGAAVYIAGDFTRYQGALAKHIAKIDGASCALDATFGASASFDGPVRALALNGNTLYVGGSFAAYQGVPDTARSIAKLDATTGALDTTFSPPSANGFDGAVHALALEGAALFVGGTFASYRGASASRLAKLDTASGALDATFDPPGGNGFDDEVDALVTSGTSVYAGGTFTTYRGSGSAKKIAKLDAASGALDTTFSPPGGNGFDGNVGALALEGTSLYVGGAFTTYRNAGTSPSIAKLDVATGAIDATFGSAGGFDDEVVALAVDGTAVYAGGPFTTHVGATSVGTHHVAKLVAASGALDTTFGAKGATADGFDAPVLAISASNGAVWAGGAMRVYGGMWANGIAKVADDGYALDTTFSPQNPNGPNGPNATGFDGDVFALAPLGSALYVGGGFDAYRGVAGSAHRIAKIDLASGAIDTAFSPAGATSNGFDDVVSTLATIDGAVYAGGAFTSYRGVADSAHRVARLDPTSGALDTTFSPVLAGGYGFDAEVRSLAVFGEAVFAGGDFTAYRGIPGAANHLAKLDRVTGTLDTTFSPSTQNGVSAGSAAASVEALAVYGNTLYIGGAFDAYRGGPANSIAKLDPTTGALDTTFSPAQGANGFAGLVSALAVAPGVVYAGGSFSSYRSIPDSAHGIARIDSASGVLDPAFDPNVSSGFDNPVNALALSGISLFVGGAFDAYRGKSAAIGAARLDPRVGDVW